MSDNGQRPGYPPGMKFALFMLFFADTYGLILLLSVPVLVMLGRPAGTTVALGVCGLGLVTWSKRGRS